MSFTTPTTRTHSSLRPRGSNRLLRREISYSDCAYAGLAKLRRASDNGHSTNCIRALCEELQAELWLAGRVCRRAYSRGLFSLTCTQNISTHRPLGAPGCSTYLPGLPGLCEFSSQGLPVL